LTDFPLYDAPELQPMPPELCEFLAGGPPPVVLTPGSAMRHAAAIFATVVRTCRATGRRGLLLTHFSDQVPADLPPHVKYFPYAPLSQVLSHSALLVHHGGIGTTAAALAAGVPQVILPFAHDQLDNAARIQRLGVGRAISPARFHPALAGRLFDELTTDSVRDHCEKVAGRLHPHHGLDETCRLIESLAT